MADTVIEMLTETGATKAYVTVVDGSGTPDVDGYDLTQIAGSLHKFTVPEAITGRVHILAKTSGDVVFGERYIDALTDTAETFDLAAGSDATLAKQNEILDGQSDIDDELVTIKGKFASTVLISQPVATSGQIDKPIIIGDDYLATNDRAFEWTIDAPTGATIANSSCSFGIVSDHGGSFKVSGLISDAGSGKWKLSFDVARTETESLTPGSYTWSVQVDDDSNNELTQVISSNGNTVRLVTKAT